jgi:hypothetical protein
MRTLAARALPHAASEDRTSTASTTPAIATTYYGTRVADPPLQASLFSSKVRPSSPNQIKGVSR